METLKEDNILFDENLEEIFEFLEKRIDKKYDSFPSFFEFKENFNKSGKQGLIGILNLKCGTNNKKEIVYKISRYMNHLVDHENTILQSLNDLREYCPHFCKGFGKITVPLDLKFRKTENPFEISSNHKLDNDVLLMEFVNAKKFYRYLKKKDFDEEIIFSIIKQVVLAIAIAQKKKGLSHYDLHSSNILIKKCDPKAFFLYILDENHKYLVPTYGYYPVIIDFGFGYVKDMDHKPMYAPLSFTDVGFMSDRFDPIADPKLFLVTVSDEVRGYRSASKKGKLFRKLIKNIFKPLKIDWESGWDDIQDISASDYVSNLLEEVHDGCKSNFFKNCGQYCIDIAQKLITLPLVPEKYKKIDKMYKLIIDEYRAIEKYISNDFYNLYIFKNIIDFALEVKEEYSDGDDEAKNSAVKKFKNNILNLLDSIAKFTTPKIEFEKLLCSLIIFSKKMGGILYEVMEERMKQKNKEYKKLKINTPEQMYEAIEANIPSEADLEEKSPVYLWNSMEGYSKKVFLPLSLISELNEIHPLSRGEIVFKHIQENENESFENDLISEAGSQSEDDEDDEVQFSEGDDFSDADEDENSEQDYDPDNDSEFASTDEDLDDKKLEKILSKYK